jgi:RNase adaptor protein for sRNA GlmZ degradation
MRLILLGGLPGSGKSFRLRELEAGGWKVFDDFQACVYRDSDQFEHSRRFDDLIHDLKEGHDCVVADIRVIHEPYRASARSALARNLGSMKLAIELFENDPQQCIQNVQRDPERDPINRVREIHHWTNHYSCPRGARVLAVWRPDE